jgi:ArsR family transcriptional regulator
MEITGWKSASGGDRTAAYADMFAALGAEPRLRILRVLLSAHPEGMVAGEIQSELGIPPSTLSHHLERLKNEGLITVQRESTYLRYAAHTAALEELLGFLYAECCTRNKAVRPGKITQFCKQESRDERRTAGRPPASKHGRKSLWATAASKMRSEKSTGRPRFR